MAVNPKTDLQLLAEYDFKGRNEAEIRGDWIETLLRLLGYGLGTRNDILRERTLKLAEPTRMIGSKRIEIDYIPTVYGEQLWIMEAKRPQEGEALFSLEHLGQAWSYATDPRIAVPLMCLCDGTRVGVYDMTRSDWDTPVFDRPKAELLDCFGELFELLGAPRIADRIRRDQLRHLRGALMAQIDQKPLDETLKDVEAIVAEARPIVDERRRQIYRETRERIEGDGTKAMDAAGIWGLAGHLNGPMWSTLNDIDHGARLIREKEPRLREREFEDFERVGIKKEGEAPRIWFWLSLARMGCAILLSEDEGCGPICRAAAEEAARDHATGFAGDDLKAASYELQRGLGPLGWRLAANQKPAIDKAAAAVADSLEAEEWLRLDAEFGLTGTAGYKFQALLGPRAMLGRIDPWDVTTVRAAIKVVQAMLGVLPKPPGMEELQPAGDPWQESWLRGDPLRDVSAATLQALGRRDGEPGPAAFASALYAEHYA
ncbi:MAG: hypothetical protein JWO14_3888 [Solirubrobacterales bacterium]|nr:hypothetical protein [Solirubrobacterales bacterium]